jgi:hypothetical protein
MKTFLIGLISLVIALGSAYFKKDMLIVKKYGEVVPMEIVEKDENCSFGTKGSYYGTFKYANQLFRWRGGFGFCESYNVGDSMNMIYLEGYDDILSEKESVNNQYIAIFIIGIVGLILMTEPLFKMVIKRR